MTKDKYRITIQFEFTTEQDVSSLVGGYDNIVNHYVHRMLAEIGDMYEPEILKGAKVTMEPIENRSTKEQPSNAV
jgi:hypothetical protein